MLIVSFNVGLVTHLYLCISRIVNMDLVALIIIAFSTPFLTSFLSSAQENWPPVNWPSAPSFLPLCPLDYPFGCGASRKWALRRASLVVSSGDPEVYLKPTFCLHFDNRCWSWSCSEGAHCGLFDFRFSPVPPACRKRPNPPNGDYRCCPWFHGKRPNCRDSLLQRTDFDSGAIVVGYPTRRQYNDIGDCVGVAHKTFSLGASCSLPVDCVQLHSVSVSEGWFSSNVMCYGLRYTNLDHASLLYLGSLTDHYILRTSDKYIPQTGHCVKRLNHGDASAFHPLATVTNQHVKMCITAINPKLFCDCSHVVYYDSVEHYMDSRGDTYVEVNFIKNINFMDYCIYDYIINGDMLNITVVTRTHFTDKVQAFSIVDFPFYHSPLLNVSHCFHVPSLVASWILGIQNVIVAAIDYVLDSTLSIFLNLVRRVLKVLQVFFTRTFVDALDLLPYLLCYLVSYYFAQDRIVAGIVVVVFTICYYLIV